MSVLTPEQIYQLVSEFGFADKITATAIVLGESGGDPRAVNRNSDTSIDRGLWQINSRWHPGVTERMAFDVALSTGYALQISQGGTNFQLWNARLHRNFPDHLRRAEQAANAVGSTGGAPSGGGSSPGWRDLVDAGGNAVLDAVPGGGIIRGAFSTAADIFAMLGKVLGVITSKDFWTRAAYILAGLALVAAAAYLVFMAPARKAALGAISDASPVGE